MVEVGRRGEGTSLPESIVGSKRACPEKKINTISEDGRGGLWCWVGCDRGASPPKSMPGLS